MRTNLADNLPPMSIGYIWENLMRPVLAALVMALTFGFPALVSADERPVASSAAQASSADFSTRVTLVRRYFSAIQFDKLLNGILENQLDAMLNQGPIPADKRSVMRDAALAAYAIVIPRMVEENIQLYAEAFSQQELEELVAFYESATGRSLTTKTVILTQNSGEIMERYMPQMEQEMTRQLCSRIDCEAEGLTR